MSWARSSNVGQLPRAPAQPTSSAERQDALDALRGLALFGVGLANVQHFSGCGRQPALGALHAPLLDAVTSFLLNALADGKFYSLFALLFGVGLALQLERGDPRAALSRFRRRMSVLFAVGLLHACLLWYGDILAFYAVMACLAVLLRQLPTRQLLRVSVLAFALPVLLHLVFLAFLPVRSEAHPEQLRIAAAARVAQGSYAELVHWNVTRGLAQRALDLFATGRPFKVLALLLLGMLAVREDWLSVSERQRARWFAVLRWGLAIGVPCNLGLALLMRTAAYERLEPVGILQPLVYAYGVPALSLAYAAGVALLWARPGARRVLRPLCAVGRMSLTNYLGQSLLFALLFDTWGFGLFGQLGFTAALVVAAAVFGLQLLLSRIWLGHFLLGPAEWLWRRLAYACSVPLLPRGSVAVLAPEAARVRAVSPSQLEGPG